MVLILVFYEAMQIAEGYTFSLVIKFFEMKPEYSFWVIFLVCLFVYDEIFMRMDNRVDWQIIAHQSYQLYRFLKLKAIKKFLNLDIAWHQKQNSGTLVGKVHNGVEKVDEMIGMLSWEFVPTLIQTVLSLIPLLFLSPVACLVAALSFVYFLWLALAGNRERQPLKEKRFDLYDEEWHRSVESVQAVETIYMFGQTQRMLDEQETLHKEIINLGIKEAHRGVYHYNRWQIRGLRWARRTVLAIWIYQLYAGTLDIPNLIFANVLLEKLFSSFWRLSRLLEKAAESAEGAQRLGNLLDEQSAPRVTGDVKEPQTLPVGIRFEDVCFSYVADYKADDGGLHDLSLEIPPGKVTALVGPSGAGKTTIRKVITGLIPVQSGRIMVGGASVEEWDQKSLLGQFSYVPQGDDVFLFNETIRANIAFAKPEATNEETVKAAQLAGIHEFITTLPKGYETVVGERGKRLSGGQKQRVALARAIIANRPILILDEATSSVDAITEEEIQQRMKEILADKTAIVIAHRLSTVWDIAHKIVVLDMGRKVEEGTHEELMELGGLYAKMAALQTKEGSV